MYGGRTDAAVLEDRQQLAVFDPAAGAWLDPGRVGGAMPLGRSSHRAVALGNRCGGGELSLIHISQGIVR